MYFVTVIFIPDVVAYKLFHTH